MDISRGNHQRQSTQPRQQEPAVYRNPSNGQGGRASKWPLIAACAVALLLVAGSFIWVYLQPTQRINSSRYQVVYLVSGQAYFGKLRNTDGHYLVIDTPYTAQDVKAADAKEGQATSTLMKVSSQLYGPEESIAIHSDQVAFWQNLRDDSKVTQAIKSKQ